MNENRNTPIEDVLIKVRTTLARPIKDERGTVELVGCWLWIDFPEKPSAELRTSLKDAGFWWNDKRGSWCHSGGNHSWHSKGSPKDNYSVAEVSL